MRDNVSADWADPGVNPLLSAAKHSMAVNLAVLGLSGWSLAGVAPNRPSAIILTVARAARKANIRLYQADRGLMDSTFFPEAVATRIIRTEMLGESAPAVGDTSGLAAPFLGGIA